jgi:hypothetical protein
MTIEDPGLLHVSEGRRRLVRTRTGLVIGIAHQPKPKPASDDAERIQSALLDPCTARPLPMLKRMWRAIVRWL